MAFEHPKLDNFHNDSFTRTFKTRVMDMSKLLCEVWLERERGILFKDSLKQGKNTVKEALAECKIYWPDDFLNFELDTSTYNGSIEMSEDLHRGLTFLWKLPYAAWPEKGITESEITGWIETVDEWLEKTAESPQEFPTPPNIYIPLATT
jgi:hypothetical protein